MDVSLDLIPVSSWRMRQVQILIGESERATMGMEDRGENRARRIRTGNQPGKGVKRQRGRGCRGQRQGLMSGTPPGKFSSKATGWGQGGPGGPGRGWGQGGLGTGAGGEGHLHSRATPCGIRPVHCERLTC